MITVDFTKREKKGLCDYLYDSIKSQIVSGQLSADEKLPSKRSLADHLGVSVITVQNAYSLLAVEGYIYSVEKCGYFVTDIKNDITPKKSESSLTGVWNSGSNSDSVIRKKNQEKWIADFSSNATGYEKFPFSLWARTMRNVLNSGEKNLLQKIESKGVFELRLAIAKHLLEFRDMNVSPDNIVIGAGSESLYTTLIQLLGENQCYAVENPGYKKIASVFGLNKAKWLAIDMDDEGMNPALLETSGATVIHVSPSHHFPTGTVMSVRRRNELLSWANKEGFRYIIEDDYDSEFRFTGKPLPTLQSADTNGKVIYINTFTKTLSPSFRISYMVLPEQLSKKYEQTFGSFSSPVSAFEQFTLSRFILDGNFARHIIRMKNYYRSLRNELIEAFSDKIFLDKIKIHEEESGLHFLLTVCDEKLGVKQLNDRLLVKRIKIPLLKDFYYSPVQEEKEKTFVVNYSGIQKKSVASIVEGFKEVLI